MLEVLVGTLLLAGLSSQKWFERDRHRTHVMNLLIPPPEARFVPGAMFNPEQPFSVSGITFDAQSGLGSTSDGSSVNYMGFVIWMTPRQFLALNPPRDLSKGSWVRERIKEGVPISPPFLQVEITRGEELSEKELWELERSGKEPWGPRKPLGLRVWGHEGRTRSAALIALGLGDTPIPITIFISGGVRARHLLPGHLLGAVLIPDQRCEKYKTTHRCEPLQIEEITLDQRNFSTTHQEG